MVLGILTSLIAWIADLNLIMLVNLLKVFTL